MKRDVGCRAQVSAHTSHTIGSVLHTLGIGPVSHTISIRKSCMMRLVCLILLCENSVLFGDCFDFGGFRHHVDDAKSSREEKPAPRSLRGRDRGITNGHGNYQSQKEVLPIGETLQQKQKPYQSQQPPHRIQKKRSRLMQVGSRSTTAEKEKDRHSTTSTTVGHDRNDRKIRSEIGSAKLLKVRTEKTEKNNHNSGIHTDLENLSYTGFLAQAPVASVANSNTSSGVANISNVKASNATIVSTGNQISGNGNSSNATQTNGSNPLTVNQTGGGASSGNQTGGNATVVNATTTSASSGNQTGGNATAVNATTSTIASTPVPQPIMIMPLAQAAPTVSATPPPATANNASAKVTSDQTTAASTTGKESSQDEGTLSQKLFRGDRHSLFLWIYLFLILCCIRGCVRVLGNSRIRRNPFGAAATLSGAHRNSGVPISDAHRNTGGGGAAQRQPANS